MSRRLTMLERLKAAETKPIRIRRKWRRDEDKLKDALREALKAKASVREEKPG